MTGYSSKWFSVFHCDSEASQASFSLSAFDDDNFAEVTLDGVTDGMGEVGTARFASGKIDG